VEVVVWYILTPGGKQSQRWYVHLPDFSDESLVVPLYALLRGGGDDPPPVFDQSVYRDPRLDDMDQWDGSWLKEVKRVNPDLVRLLAGVKPADAARLAEAWFASAPVQDFFRGPTEGARAEVGRMLAELPPLARAARKRRTEVLQDFLWPTA
jgi:hypothetical protein